MEPEGLARLRVFVRTLGAVAHELQGKLSVARALVGDVPAAQAQLEEIAGLLGDMGRIGDRAGAVALDVSAIAASVIAEARDRPKWRGVTFAWTGSTVRLDGDGRLIARVFLALVGNAADACAGVGGGTVTVTASIGEMGEFVDFAVGQTAPLPSAERLEGLLQPDFSSSKRTSGFGMGIPTVCAVADAHGGSLDADADARAFVLRLPVSRGEVRRIGQE